MDQFERAEQSLIVPVQSRAVATALTPIGKDYGATYRAGDATRRHDRTVEAGAAGAAGVTGTRAVRARGEAKTQRGLSATYRQAAGRADDVLAQRMMRHANAGHSGGLPTTNRQMKDTATAVRVTQNLHGKAGDAAKAAFRASRKAKGAAAATAGLAGLAAAVHHREQPEPLRSLSYR